jgi:hypothetical protein
MTTPTLVVLDAGSPLRRAQRIALVVGALGLVATALGAVLDVEQALRSYLAGFVFWTGAGLGCLAILMINHLTGGAWGASIRRLLESGAGTLPVMAIFFIPIAVGMERLYEWADPEVMAHDPLLQAKQPYLNVPFFLVRALVYFGVWTLLARSLSRWSLAHDQTDDPKPAYRLELWSRGGLVLFGLTGTFAAFDWMMSLEPHWYSTIYGLLYLGGGALTAFAVMIPLAALLSSEGPLRRVITPDVFHDLGKLMLAFVMLWAYFAFSQFLIVWSANLTEEIPWYLRRLEGGWQWVALAIVIFHFGLPFLLLLSRRLKRNPRQLAAVAIGLVVVRYLDVFWLVAPAFEPDRFALHLLDVTAVLGLGGVWLWTLVWLLDDKPLVPLRDPSLVPES